MRKGDRVDGTQAVMLEALVEQEESVTGGLFGEFVAKLGLAAFVVVALYLFAHNLFGSLLLLPKTQAMTILALFVLLVSQFWLLALYRLVRWSVLEWAQMHFGMQRL